MDKIENISLLPIKLLVEIFKYVPVQKNLFTVCKSFYDAACIASKSNYRISFHGNSEIRNHFDSIVKSKRLFHDLAFRELDSQAFSNNDIKKLLTLCEMFGPHVTYLSISCKVFAEKDVRYMMSFFRNIEGLSINRDYSKSKTAPRVLFGQINQSLNFPKLKTINFNCKGLHFDIIFENVQLTDKFKSLDVTLPEPTGCFKFLKKHASIESLSITSRQSAESIPITHLKLKSLRLCIPNSKQLLPFLEQQTELLNLDLNSDYEDEDYEDEDCLDSSYDSGDESTSSSYEGNDGDIDLLTRAAKISNLSTLHISIDGISNEDFDHFSKLSNLKQLSITSHKLSKITRFSIVSLLNVTRMLLHFKGVQVPTYVFNRIASNFPNVNDLHYEGGYFCDAFLCFAGNLKSLEKFNIMRTVDYENDRKHYVPSSNTQTSTQNAVNSTLKSVTLYFSFPNEVDVHSFLIRLALTAPNVENLWIHTDSMKIIHNNFIYILRNFKHLKNINLSYDLYPDELESLVMQSMSRVEEHAKANELKIINSLKEYGSRLDYVELSLSNPNQLQNNLWHQSFYQQFPSIKIDDTSVIMKKDERLDQWKLFA